MCAVATQYQVFTAEIFVISKGTIHFVGVFGGLGGTEKATLEEMLMLREAGYHVVYTCITPMGRFCELLEANGIEWKSCEYRGPCSVLSFIKIWRRLSEVVSLRIVLVSHNIIAMLCCLLQGKRTKTFMRQHYHHFGMGTIPRWKWILTYAIASISVSNIAYVCNYIREEAIRIWPGLVNRSCVIYNIFSVQPDVKPEAKGVIRNELGISNGSFVMGGAGRFEDAKRWDVWCNIARRLMVQDPDMEILIVGSGSHENLICRLVEEFPQRVFFKGLMGEMSDFYKAIDLLLFVSAFDATPRVPMEAITWKIPVVAAVASGGLQEVFPKDRYPFFSHLNECAVADKILKRDEWLKPSEGEAGLEKFSRHTILKKYEKWLGVKSDS